MCGSWSWLPLCKLTLSGKLLVTIFIAVEPMPEGPFTLAVG